MSADRQMRRTWRRLERRGMAGYQQDQLAGLQRLAAHASAITGVDTRSVTHLAVLRLHLTGWALTLVGVLPAYRDTLAAQIRAGAALRLVDGGRYPGLWWITVSDGQALTLVAGTHLRLTLPAGGIRTSWNGAALVS